MTYAELAEQFSLSERVRMFGSVFSKRHRKRIPFDLWPMQVATLDLIEKDLKAGIWQCFRPKARQLGASELAAERAKDSAYRFEGIQCNVVSKKADDAEYFLAQRILPKLLHDQENIPRICAMLGIPTIDFPRLVWPTEPKKAVSKIELSNGSIFSALPATNNSGASTTADIVICDEAGGFDEVGDLRTLLGNLEPTLEEAVIAGIGWMEVIGTSEPGSSFNEIVDELWKKPQDYPTRRLIFSPWQCKPSRTPEWYAQQLVKDPVMTRLQYPATLTDFFTVKTGLIYPEFEYDRHVVEFDPNPSDVLYELYDQGFRHGSSILFMYFDRSRRLVKIWDEMTHELTPVDTIALELRRAERKLAKKAHKKIADTSIFKETGVVSIAKVFAKHGIVWKPAFKSDEQSGISLVKSALSHGRLILHPRCTSLISEFQTHKWHKNGKNPEDANNDGLDALRYGITEVHGQGGAGSEAYVIKDPYSHIGPEAGLPGFEFHRGGSSVTDSREQWEKNANL